MTTVKFDLRLWTRRLLIAGFLSCILSTIVLLQLDGTGTPLHYSFNLLELHTADYRGWPFNAFIQQSTTTYGYANVVTSTSTTYDVAGYGWIANLLIAVLLISSCVFVLLRAVEHRRIFRLSLKTLLLLTATVGLLAGAARELERIQSATIWQTLSLYPNPRDHKLYEYVWPVLLCAFACGAYTASWLLWAATERAVGRSRGLLTGKRRDFDASNAAAANPAMEKS